MGEEDRMLPLRSLRRVDTTSLLGLRLCSSDLEADLEGDGNQREADIFLVGLNKMEKEEN